MPNFELEGPVGAVANVSGKTCSYFGGTSYYCLHGRQELIRAAAAAIREHGIGAASGRAGVGVTSILRNVERSAMRFFAADDAVYLASGFLTGMAAMHAVSESVDLIVADEATHVSNILAAKSTGKQVHFFRHLDADDLEHVLSANIRADERPLIVTDGVFPAFGEIAPVDRYLTVSDEFGGLVWVDDAHGLGVLGRNGRGTCEHFSLKSDQLLSGGSLAKAIGGFGGIIFGASDFVESVRHGAVAVAASNPGIADTVAATTGLNFLIENPDARNRLRENTHRLKTAFREIGIVTDNSPVPIVAWRLDDMQAMRSLRDSLFEAGVYIQLVQDYSQLNFKALLRVSVFSEHNFEQIDHLATQIGRFMQCD